MLVFNTTSTSFPHRALTAGPKIGLSPPATVGPCPAGDRPPSGGLWVCWDAWSWYGRWAWWALLMLKVFNIKAATSGGLLPCKSTASGQSGVVSPPNLGPVGLQSSASPQSLGSRSAWVEGVLLLQHEAAQGETTSSWSKRQRWWRWFGEKHPREGGRHWWRCQVNTHQRKWTHKLFSYWLECSVSPVQNKIHEIERQYNIYTYMDIICGRAHQVYTAQ